MANDFYNRVFNPLPGQRVDEQVLKDEFQRIEQGFDEVEVDADRAIKLPIGTPDQTLAMDAGQRANLVLAFDASGNITATSFGRWRGDWVTATAYVVNDSFRYAPTGSVYTVLVAHTSGVFADDLAANKFSLAIDGTGAAAAAASAAAAATSASNAATSESNAAGSAGTASAAAVSAAASFDAFDDIFLGAKASDPTTDNDGNALQTGALYFNTTVAPKEMRVYDGSAWAAAYLPAAGYATLTGTQTLTNKTIDSASNSLRIRLTRDPRTSNTIITAADIGKWIDITSGTFTQTSDNAATLGAGFWCELGNSGTGVATYSGLAIYQGQRYRIHSDGTTIRTTPLADQGLLIVTDEKTSGTAAQSLSATTWTQRDLNTVKVNSISGASVASNLVTLGAGTYEFDIWANGYENLQSMLRIYNVTAAAVVAYGSSEYAFASQSPVKAWLRVKVTLAVTSALRLEHYSTGGGVGGRAANIASVPETYVNFTTRKVG